MKTKLFCSFFLLLCFSVLDIKAQVKPVIIDMEDYYSPSFKLTVDTTSKDIAYTNTIQEPGSKEELFKRADEFFAKEWITDKPNLTLIDPVNGYLIVNISMFYSVNEIETGTVGYTVTIRVRDNEYQYLINNFHIKSGSNALTVNLKQYLDYLSPMVSAPISNTVAININGFIRPDSKKAFGITPYEGPGLINTLISEMKKPSMRSANW